MKRCPPGVICIENITIILILIIIVAIGYYIYIRTGKPSKQEINVSTNIEQRPNNMPLGYFGITPSYPYNNMPKDILQNPYDAPLKDERYFVSGANYIPPNAMPINVSTSAVDTSYRQLGILTATNSKGKILPLMGRPVFTNRDKWQYYTMSDQNNSVKLPIIYKGRSCTNEYGCDQLYNGDRVYVEGYNQAFKITIYENDVIKYIPYL